MVEEIKEENLSSKLDKSNPIENRSDAGTFNKKEEDDHSSTEKSIYEDYKNWDDIVKKQENFSNKLTKLNNDFFDFLKNQYKKDIDEMAKGVENKIKESKREAKESEKEIRKEIDNSKLSVIETLGIFVALFTFISVEFQILKNTTSIFSMLGLSFVMLGSLVFFVLILHLVLNKDSRRIFNFLLGTSLLFIIMGSILACSTKIMKIIWLIIN